MSKKKESGSEKNPQLMVINTLLEDWKGVEEATRILILGPEKPKPKKAKKDPKDKDSEVKDSKAEQITDLLWKISNLPERHLALIQVLRRDNYYRNLNPKLLKIFHWLVPNAQEAIESGEFENAAVLTLAWESKMQELYQECSPNERDFRLAMLDAISKMSIMAMPGAMKAYSVSGDIPRELDWKG